MRVSVIIPTYRPDNYLFDCLNSLARQTIDKSLIEVLLVLNGPKDPYFVRIEKFLGQLTNINVRLSYCSIAHVSAARNQGIELAKGEYLIFIDDDDIISANFVEGLLKEATKTGVVFSNVLSFKEHIKDSEKINLSFTYDKNKLKAPNWMSLRSHMSLVWGKLFPSEMISESRFDPRFKNGQDALFMALISSRIQNYRLAKEDVIYFWRIRPESASRKSKSVFYEIKNTIRLMGAYLKIYISAPFDYNLIFFLGRQLAVVKRLLYRLPESKL